MPSKQWLLRNRIEEYLDLLKKEKRSENTTIPSYRRELNRMFDALNEAGLEVSPKKIGKREIEYLREKVLTQSERWNRLRLSVLDSFLKWNGNNVVEQMRIGWPHDMRINANWLEDDEALALMRTAEGIERVIVHLELDLCMRRAEILRLRPQDFRGDRVNVLGKGRMGGKWRTIPYHPQTREIVGKYLLERKRLIERAIGKNPSARIPDSLLIYERNGKLGAYKKGAIDKFVKGLRGRMELLYDRSFEFSNHTLRRTGG